MVRSALRGLVGIVTAALIVLAILSKADVIESTAVEAALGVAAVLCGSAVAVDWYRRNAGPRR